MLPIQPLTMFRMAAACGLLTVTLPLESTIVPPPLEAIHSSASRQALVGLALEDEPGKIGVSGLFAVDDLGRLLLEFVPRLGRSAEAVLREQIGAVVQHAEV